MTIKLRLGDFTSCAFVCAKEHDEALTQRRVKGATIYVVKTDADREHALAILWYLESSPAFWGDDTELSERSAARRTSRTWRKALGIGEHDKLATPYTAKRVLIDKPTDEELQREKRAREEAHHEAQ